MRQVFLVSGLALLSMVCVTNCSRDTRQPEPGGGEGTSAETSEQPRTREAPQEPSNPAARQKEAADLIAATDRSCREGLQSGGAVVFGGDTISCGCDLEKAATAYARAASLDATSTTAHRRLALLLSHLGDYKRAATAYQRALDLQPSRGHLLELATALELSGEREAASHVLLHTPLPKSNDVYLLNRLAEIAHRGGDEAMALKYYRTAAGREIPEGDTGLEFAQTEAQLAVLRMEQGRSNAPPKLTGPACVR
jgi:tetratricopeptide (TPR) repeat protein